MEPIRVLIDERLEGAGSVLPLSGHIDEPGYELGGREFKLPGGIDYDLVLTNALARAFSRPAWFAPTSSARVTSLPRRRRV